MAPGFLEIATGENADQLAAKVRDAGAIFVSRFPPEVIEDYVAGTNRVADGAELDTSGLGVYDFMKRTSLLKLDADIPEETGSPPP